MTEKKAIIYCSASYDIDPEYNEVAAGVVRLLCARGYSIGSGVTIKGTMKVVVDVALECGAHVWGAIPRFMKGLEHPAVTDLVWTDTMAQRKHLMREGTSVAVALPGGIGTLEEVIETFTLVKLNQYQGKVIAYNHNGFYEPLKTLLDHYVETKMMDQETREKMLFPSTLEELGKLI